MKEKILNKAKEDIPLYSKDFNDFWNVSISNIGEDDLYEIYYASLIFKNWKSAFHSLSIKSFDHIIDELYEDINSSFYLALFGLYRSAHMHMRSSIELSTQLIYFIDHPVEFEKWEKGKFVIKHSVIAEYLINHPKFIIDIKPLIENLTKNWKFFSKHIHGESPIFFQCEKETKKTNTFSLKDFKVWKSNYLRNIYIINKLLLLYYKKELNLFPENSRKLLTSFLSVEDQKLFFK